jgi:transposase
MRIQKRYDDEFKKSALKLADEIGVTKASRELGIPDSTFYIWRRKATAGEIDFTPANKKAKAAQSLAEENKQLKQELRQKDMELRDKERTIEILREASIFFAQGRKK